MKYQPIVFKALVIGIGIGILACVTLSPVVSLKNLVQASFNPRQSLAVTIGGVATQSANLKMTIDVPAVSVTVFPNSGRNALTLSTTGDNCFTLYGYPTTYGPGINWSPSSGGIIPGIDVSIGIDVNRDVPKGTYTGTGVLSNCNPNAYKITFPVTVIVTQPSPSPTFSPPPPAHR